MGFVPRDLAPAVPELLAFGEKARAFIRPEEAVALALPLHPSCDADTRFAIQALQDLPMSPLVARWLVFRMEEAAFQARVVTGGTGKLLFGTIAHTL